MKNHKKITKKIADVLTLLMMLSVVILFIVYISMDTKQVDSQDYDIVKYHDMTFQPSYAEANAWIEESKSTESTITTTIPNVDSENSYDSSEINVNEKTNNSDESTEEYSGPNYHNCIHVISPEGYNTCMISYMDYKKITCTSSNQYKLQQQSAYTDYETGIRMVNGRYCIAIGSFYTTKIGTYIDVYLDNGSMIPCIVADCKANENTDINNQVDQLGGIIEFVIDSSVMSEVSNYEYVMGNCTTMYDWWNSPVAYCMVYPYGQEIY